MASVKTVYECPRCEAPLIGDKRPDECPVCKFSFGEATLVYKTPMPLSEQRVRLKNDGKFYEAILDLSIEKANDILNDALNIVETLPAKNVKVSDISQVVRMAIKIGQLATKYHEFLIEGGKHVPDLFIQAEEVKENERKKDRIREEPPPST